MLFNDEVHTYEQVIYTLQKAVNCTQKEAIGFATTVDRDVSKFLSRTFAYPNVYFIRPRLLNLFSQRVWLM